MNTLRAAFSGVVRCESQADALNLDLRGRERQTDLPLQVLFSGVTPAVTLPAVLGDAEVRELAGEGRWQLSAAGCELTINARAMHVHVDAARPFYAALGLPAAGLGRRAQWAALFTLLRLPGAARLLRKIKGS